MFNAQRLIQIEDGRVEFNAATNYLLAALAAATILSKRLSPRKESQHGLKRRSGMTERPGFSRHFLQRR